MSQKYLPHATHTSTRSAEAATQADPGPLPPAAVDVLARLSLTLESLAKATEFALIPQLQSLGKAMLASLLGPGSEVRLLSPRLDPTKPLPHTLDFFGLKLSLGGSSAG